MNAIYDFLHTCSTVLQIMGRRISFLYFSLALLRTRNFESLSPSSVLSVLFTFSRSFYASYSETWKNDFLLIDSRSKQSFLNRFQPHFQPLTKVSEANQMKFQPSEPKIIFELQRYVIFSCTVFVYKYLIP